MKVVFEKIFVLLLQLVNLTVQAVFHTKTKFYLFEGASRTTVLLLFKARSLSV